MIKMLKVKEILLKFQEDIKFIEKVANSNTIDKLYEVFCEYEYNSDINSFESEIYELLSNSDLVKKSIDEEALERISGGANMRKKIMSVIALSSLAMGGIAPITHVDADVVLPGQKNKKVTRVDAENVTAKPQSRKCYDTLLPVKEWEAIGGMGLLTTILGLVGGGYIYHRHTKSKSNTQVHMPTPITGFQEHREQRSNLDFSGFDDGGGNGDTYNFDEEGGFEKALECIKTWHKNEPAGNTEFPPKIVDAVEKIEKTFFPYGKPEAIDIQPNAYLTNGSPTKTSLKKFPTCINDCQDDKYFKPLSYMSGEGRYDAQDPYMLHKCLYQYLCRLLCFVDGVKALVVSECFCQHNGRLTRYTDKGPRFRNILLGYEMPYPYQTNSSCYSDYSQFFTVAYDDSKISNGETSPVTQLIGTVMSMYLGNLPESNQYRQGNPKIGVLCGKKPRDIDN